MLIYGSGTRTIDPRALLGSIREALAEAARETGIVRHGWLATALLEAGELAQGLADAAFAARGERDGPDGPSDAAMALAGGLARRLLVSWDTDFATDGPEGESEAALALCGRTGMPPAIDVRLPEGFAHYGLYPETYGAAARSLPAADRWRVVGLRSIGTTLAAIVAAALPGGAGAVTLRPVGHPFDRRVAPGAELDPAMAPRPDGPATRWAIVDEGPGLSGSSLAAAGGWLERLGVPPDRIHVLPGHDGEPGPEAGEAVRAFWARADRRTVPFDALAGETARPAHRLAAWFADAIGRPTGPPRDLTGGGWRELRGLSDAPAHPWAEARKILLTGEAGPVLLRFNGIGRIGRTRFDLARRLAAEGFVPKPLAWRHGFTAESWRDDARPLDLVRDRPALLDRLAAYLGFRARAFPAGPGAGASVATLLDMLRRNGRDLPGVAALADRLRPSVDDLEARRRPVLTDNRLHAWEWLVVPDGLLKADAVDHHAGHDLVGPQDPAWDVAGASVEFGLTPDETDGLGLEVGRAAGRDFDPILLSALRPCYLAFQYGAATMAADAAAPGPERARHAAETRRYGTLLLQCTSVH